MGLMGVTKIRKTNGGATAPPVPEIPPDELDRRVAVVREAKRLAKIHAETDWLTREEVDLVLAAPADFRPKLVPSLKARGVPPCARCGDTGGRPHMRPDRPPSTAPQRLSARPFGVEGGVCRRCYDQLYKFRDRDAGGVVPQQGRLIEGDGIRGGGAS
jgi:hypothetical protein